MSKSRIIETIGSFISKLLIAPIRFYQVFISPLFPPCCRFEPSCSQYGIEAFKKLGPSKGLYLTFIRILRCNPFSKGGKDPVPEKYEFKFIGMNKKGN